MIKIGSKFSRETETILGISENIQVYVQNRSEREIFSMAFKHDQIKDQISAINFDHTISKRPNGIHEPKHTCGGRRLLPDVRLMRGDLGSAVTTYPKCNSPA